MHFGWIFESFKSSNRRAMLSEMEFIWNKIQLENTHLIFFPGNNKYFCGKLTSNKW